MRKQSLTQTYTEVTALYEATKVCSGKVIQWMTRAEIGVMQLQIKECQRTPEITRVRRRPRIILS
jgi:hypothetical protein